MDRFKPTKYDKIQDDETAEAVEKAHTQNTDTKLDEGGANEVTVVDINDAIDKKHEHLNKAILDLVEEAFTSALKTAYDDAVTKVHEHPNKTTLDLVEEALTTALKTAYDDAVTKAHAHANKAILDLIEEAFTTILKNKLDGIESGAVALTTVKADADISDAIEKKHFHANKAILDAIEQAFTTVLKNKLDGIEAGAVSLATVKADGDIADAISKKHSHLDQHLNLGTGELKIKVFAQATEPTLNADEYMAIWKDTGEADRIYLLFRRGVGDQVAVELTEV